MVITRFPEFLKAAIMQSPNCAKCLRICAKVWLKNARSEKLELIFVFSHNLLKFDRFLCMFSIFSYKKGIYYQENKHLYYDKPY